MRNPLCVRAVLSIALLFLSLPVIANGQVSHPRLDAHVREARGGPATVPVLVRARPGAAARVRAALDVRRVRVDRELAGGALLRVVVPGTAIDDLAAIPGVERLSFDAVVRAEGQQKKNASTTSDAPAMSTTDGFSGFTEWWTSAAQDAVLRGTLGLGWGAPTGTGVVVAVIDSGIDGSLPAFANRISAFYDFTKGGRKATATDAYGHGSHVAGLIGAAAETFRGLAPGVTFVGMKVLDAAGQGSTSNVIAAIDFVIANQRRLGVHIINLSLGHPILEPAATDPLVQAVERAVAAGIVVVTSAGNHGTHPTTGAVGYAGVTSPGNAPSAITAGSLDMHGTADRRDDRVSTFSSRGPTWFDGLVKPDVVAPGHGLFAVASTDSALARTAGTSSAGTALKLFGTSMAAATTTGVVALLLEANRVAFPEARPLPPGAIKAVLQYSSIAVPDSSSVEADVLTQGAGGVNAAGAVALARVIDPAAAVGHWWLAAPIDEWSRLAGLELPWTRRIIWGDTLLTGQAIYANAPAWQTTVVWGDTFIWGDALIWGDGRITGDTFIWGENVVISTAPVWSTAIVWGDGLVTIDGQALIWGDTFIWGEALIWGDTFVWGDSVSQTPLP